MNILHVTISRRIFCLLVVLVVFCSVSYAIGPKMFMSNTTKNIYTEINDNYVWKTIQNIINNDIKTFSSYMNEEDKSILIYLKQFDPQTQPIDLFWDAEKDSLNKTYGDKISKLNKVQRNLLYEELNHDWKDFVKKYRYNYALFANYLDCNQYIKLLEKERQDSITNSEKEIDLENRITNIQEENKAKKQDLANLENEYNRLRESKSQLQKEIYQAQSVKDWIQGTWEYSDYGITCRVEINEENLKVYMDGSLEYNGIYSIDGNKIKYSMGKGMSGTIGLDNTNHRLMADNYNSFTRISYSPLSYSQTSTPSYSQSSIPSPSISSSTTQFHSLSDVWSYLESHTWRCGRSTVKIKTQSLIVNGEPYLAMAPQVIKFTTTSATISINLIPSGTLIYNVYPQKGVMYDNDNNTYTLK